MRYRRATIFDPLFYLRAVIVISCLALVVLPLLTDGALAISQPLKSGDTSCRVVRVIDGDTLDLWCSGSGFERARLVGFDAPELFSPDCTSELIAAQKAKWALRGILLTGKVLSLKRGRSDKYDRRLVMITVDGNLLSHRMIEDGHARAYGRGQRQSWCA
jgi:micrococcal nuclease